MTWLANTCVLLSLSCTACIEFDSPDKGAEDAGLPSEPGQGDGGHHNGGGPSLDAGPEGGLTDGSTNAWADAGPPLAPRAPNQAGDLIITEIMYDPIAPDDSVGEWFEVHNATEQTLRLEGCILKDAAQDRFTFPATWIMLPKAYATFARSGMPGGFTPTFVVSSGFLLADIADEIEIVCSGTSIDKVAYNEVVGFGSPAGASLSLSGNRLSATDNDEGESWCAGAARLAANLGSPGAGNADCAGLEDCAVTPCLHGTCANVAGRNRCDCSGTGYTGSLCNVDVDECLADTDGCDDDPNACQNTKGSFICACPFGQTGTGIGALGCCSPQSAQVCDSGDLYWADSCGKLGEKVQECGVDGCDAAKCNGSP